MNKINGSNKKRILGYSVLAVCIFFVVVILIIPVLINNQQQSTYIYQPPRYHMDWRLHDSFTATSDSYYPLYVDSSNTWKIEWTHISVGENRFIATLYYSNWNVFDSIDSYGLSGEKEYSPGIDYYEWLRLKVNDGTWMIKIYVWGLVPY